MGKTKKEIAAVVTTAHRGVFFGYISSDQDITAKILRLTKARLAVFWSSDTKGFMGLAVTGPQQGSRIGPEAPAVTVQDVTSVTEATDEAIQQWNKDLWA